MVAAAGADSSVTLLEACALSVDLRREDGACKRRVARAPARRPTTRADDAMDDATRECAEHPENIFAPLVHSQSNFQYD